MKTNICKCGCGNLCELNYLKGHGRKGKKCSEEHKRKMRISKINHIYNKNGGICPMHNIIRQNEIINKLNCAFYRYNEKKGELYEII